MGCAATKGERINDNLKQDPAYDTNASNGLRKTVIERTVTHNKTDYKTEIISNNNDGQIKDKMGSNVSKIKSDNPRKDLNSSTKTNQQGIVAGEFNDTKVHTSENKSVDEKRSDNKENGDSITREINDKSKSDCKQNDEVSELPTDGDDKNTEASNLSEECLHKYIKETGNNKGQNKIRDAEVQTNKVGIGKSQDEEKIECESQMTGNGIELTPVIANYVGSGDHENVKPGSESNAGGAYASYVGSDSGVKDAEASSSESDPKYSKFGDKIKVDTEQHVEKTGEEKRSYQEEINDKKSCHSDNKTDNLTEVANDLEYPDDGMSGPAPTLVKAKDIMPRADVLQILADQVKRSPIALKPSLGSLVKRLTKPAKTDLEKVWAFYRWIVINIKFDVDGFFGDTPPRPTDPASVLKSGMTLCEGYTNLVQAFCEKSDVESKIIKGYAKPYGYCIGDDVSKLNSCQHAWNAVLIDGKWFLMDCTWGAGFVKPKDKKYIRWPNDFYFLTDPDVFVSDHFPMMDDDYDTSCKWQLLEMPITLEIFIMRVNMDQPGKEWGILTHHHPYAVIDVQNEAEIMVQESHTPMLSYLVHMRNNDFQLMDQFTFAYKSDTKTYKVHVRPPAIGEYMCQIYGRRVDDGEDAHHQPLVLYKLNCTEVYDRPREFPTHSVTYGPVPDIASFGFSHTGNVLYKAEFGEVTILLNPKREVSFIPHLYIGDTEFDYLRENCIVQYSEDFRHLSVSLRLPFEGFFRLTLFGKRTQMTDDDNAETSKAIDTPYNIKFRRPKSNSSRKSAADEMKPFVSYLIDNRQASDKEPFPFAHTTALKYKCCLLQPNDKEVKTEREIKVCLRSLFLERVKAGDDLIPKVDETTFSGSTVTTKADSKFIIYGSDSKDGDDFVALYECTTSR